MNCVADTRVCESSVTNGKDIPMPEKILVDIIITAY